MKTTSAATDYRLSREAGAATVVAMAASERGDLVLGTDAGEIEVLRLPARFAAYSPVGFLPPWGRPEIAEPQRVLSVRTSPPGEPVTDLAVALTPAGGVVAVAVHRDGTVAAVPVVDGVDPVVTTMPGALLVDAAFTLTDELVVAVATSVGVEVWWPESGRRETGEMSEPPTCLALLGGRAAATGLVIGDRTGFSVHDVDTGIAAAATQPVDGGVADVAAWRWPDGTFRLATIPASGPPSLTITPLTAGSWEIAQGRTHALPASDGSVVRLLHTRDLLAVVDERGAVELLPLAAAGHQRLPASDALGVAALMRSPDGRPALASVTADGEVILRELDLQRQPGDELLTLNNDAAIGTIDLLDFGVYARPLSIVISAQETDTPLVIGIDGQWGQGKTRLGHMVDAELPTERRQMTGELACHSIWFNAWMHSDADDLATAIAASVAVGVQPLRPWWRRLLSPTPGRAIGGLRRYGRIIAMVVAVLAGAALLTRPEWLERAYDATGIEGGRALFSLGGLSVTLGLLRLVALVRDQVGGVMNAFLSRAGTVVQSGRVAEVRDDLGRRIADATRAIPDPQVPSTVLLLDRLRTWALRSRSGVLRNLVRRPLAAVLGVRHARRVVLFVDDLDRCNSARSVEACEALSQLLDHPGLVTVVMVDLEALATHAEVQFTALAERIHPDRKGAGWGRRFLDKVFQFEFTIPAHRSAALSVLLRSSLDARAPVPLKPDPVVGGEPAVAAGGFAALGPPDVPPVVVDPLSGYLGSVSATQRLYDATVASELSTRDSSHSLGVDWVLLPVGLGTVYTIDAVEPWWGKVLVGLVGVAVTVAVLWRQTRARMRRELVEVAHKASSLFGSDPQPAASTLGRSTASVTGAGTPPDPSGASRTSDRAVPVTRREAVKMVLEEGDHLDLAYREASRWLDGTTPRTAKRLANRLLFTTAVATERNLLWTDSSLDGRVIGKWVTLVERWPGLATAIRRDPSVLAELERAAADDQAKAFAAAVARRAPNLAEVEVLRRLLASPPSLAGHTRAFAHLAQ